MHDAQHDNIAVWKIDLMKVLKDMQHEKSITKGF